MGQLQDLMLAQVRGQLLGHQQHLHQVLRQVQDPAQLQGLPWAQALVPFQV